MYSIGIDYLDVLKIDIEGSEFPFLMESFPHHILRDRVKQMAIEIHASKFLGEGTFVLLTSRFLRLLINYLLGLAGTRYCEANEKCARACRSVYVKFARMIEREGFRIVDSRPNPWWPDCFETTYVNVRFFPDAHPLL